MKLDGCTFLAGFTARSQIYAQAMAASNIEPERVILFGPEKPILPGQTGEKHNAAESSELFIPNLEISLKTTCIENAWPFKILKCRDINEEDIIKELKASLPSFVIYSGYGSQIVGKKLLDIGSPFLHMHSGWLPDYRGSTTIYYSWLAEGRCAVSGIMLGEGIDTGPIIERKYYPPPSEKMDPDYLYDNAIRADLLVRILKKHGKEGSFESIVQPEMGSTYYVIHPVLKHLARMSCRAINNPS